MDYKEKAQEPEQHIVASEPVAAMYAPKHVVHVPVDAHGRNIDWTALQAWLAMQAQAYVVQTQEEDDDAAWLDSLCGGWNEDPRTTEEIKRSIRSARLSGVTRKIRPLTDAE